MPTDPSTPQPQDRPPEALCSRQTTKGEPCRAYAQAGSSPPTCLMHDQVAGPAARAKGGAGTARAKSARQAQADDQAELAGTIAQLAAGQPVPLSTIGEVRRALAAAGNAVISGAMPTARANALTNVLKLALAAAEADQSAEIAELKKMFDATPNTVPRRRR